MNRTFRRALPSLLLALLLALTPTLALAHSGRTDASGGHRDNKNKSGLGSYHYHCGGNPPHLHTNGVCPYAKKSSSSSGSSSKASSGSSSSSSPKKAASSGSAVSDTAAMDEVIRSAVEQGVVTPSVDPDTLAQSVDVLIAYASKTVNVREAPDADSKKLGFVPKDEKILVLQPNYTDKWHQVLFDGQIGYVSAKLCRLTEIVTRTVAIE